MRSKFFIQILIMLFIIPIFSLALVNSVNAGTQCNVSSDCEPNESCVADPSDTGKICCSTLWGCGGEDSIKDATGLGNKDPRAIAASVINVILGFLGIIAVVIILVGGFKWMTAQGNDDKVGEAKQLLTAGVIGLVIVLAAFGIAKFVIGALIGATQ